MTNVKPAKEEHFILSSRSIHGKPYDGHTLSYAISDTQAVTGVAGKKTYVDKGYKGHD